LKHLITTHVNKKFRNPDKKIKFLIDCIESHGYIQSGYKPDDETVSSDDEFEDLYQHMMPVSETTLAGASADPEFKLSIQEQEQSSIDPYGFNRTFITIDSHSSDKLNLLQKRGITYEETQFNKVKLEMENILQNFPTLETYNILQTALNIYLNILLYYKDNPFGFTENKGGLKSGYIFLCVYYSFIYNNVNIDKQELLRYSEKTRLSDLPIAEKNMKMIFNHVKGYSFMNESKTFNLNFLKTALNIPGRKLLLKIEAIIQETQEFIPTSKLGIYSIVYFTCNDYYPFKVKIIYKDRECAVTYSVLNEVFGSYASSTVRKLTDQLRQFYKK
jgi:hypothetical protein